MFKINKNKLFTELTLIFSILIFCLVLFYSAQNFIGAQSKFLLPSQLFDFTHDEVKARNTIFVFNFTFSLFLIFASYFSLFRNLKRSLLPKFWFIPFIVAYFVLIISYTAFYAFIKPFNIKNLLHKSLFLIGLLLINIVFEIVNAVQSRKLAPFNIKMMWMNIIAFSSKTIGLIIGLIMLYLFIKDIKTIDNLFKKNEFVNSIKNMFNTTSAKSFFVIFITTLLCTMLLVASLLNLFASFKIKREVTNNAKNLFYISLSIIISTLIFVFAKIYQLDFRQGILSKYNNEHLAWIIPTIFIILVTTLVHVAFLKAKNKLPRLMKNIIVNTCLTLIWLIVLMQRLITNDYLASTLNIIFATVASLSLALKVIFSNKQFSYLVYILMFLSFTFISIMMFLNHYNILSLNNNNTSFRLISSPLNIVDVFAILTFLINGVYLLLELSLWIKRWVYINKFKKTQGVKHD